MPAFKPPPACAAALLAMMLACAPAWAAPDDDLLSALLAERGVLPTAPAQTQAPQAPPSLRNRAAEMVIAAMNFVGVPYRLGGSSFENGFDCSGFTRHIFSLGMGLALPRQADEQANAKDLVRIDKAELRAGDLVFFNTLKRTFSHVGIYIGDGRFIHAPRSGSEVRIEDMRYAYWSQRFTGARRALGKESPQGHQVN
jgi:cell wall-associated NlpC family hydrolase